MADPDSQLLMLPASTLSHCFSFLSSNEYLTLRLVGQWLLNFMSSTSSDEAEMFMLWKQAIVHDFKFNPNIIHVDDPLHFLHSLKIRETHHDHEHSDGGDASGDARQAVSSIFGYPASEGVFVATSPFESWKHWARASAIFCKPNNEENRSMYINGPYFLRAAKLWSRIEEWCNNPHLSGPVGAKIKATLLPGVNRSSGRFARNCTNANANANANSNTHPMHALEAIFAFHDGQEVFKNRSVEDMETAFFGGYSVYDHVRCAFLYNTDVCERFRFDGHVAIGGNVISSSFNSIVLNVESGELGIAMLNRQRHGQAMEVTPAYKKKRNHQSTSSSNDDSDENNNDDDMNDVGLLWLEEHVRRLHEKEISVRPFDYHDAVSSSGLHIISPFPGHPSPLASRRVTRGIEVIASSLPDVDIAAIVYSLRIRILEHHEEGYVTPTERGFETCQLFSRHWRLMNSDTGRIDEVNGEGVVGRYPLLREGGGYRDDEAGFDGNIMEGNEESGTFVYQSCSNMTSGYFEGRMKFFPGSINDSTGPAFYVDVGRFPLDFDPDIWY